MGRPAKMSAVLSNAGMKGQIEDYLAGNIQSMLKDIDALGDPKDRLQARMKLFEYVMPKVQAVRTAETKTKSNAQWLLDKESGL